ncbi:MAG TPA: CBS domain-containing protein [Acidimicrobiales bacterium]|nr:CBS domain-containing protein [Acidimicrobiales bacterium]
MRVSTLLDAKGTTVLTVPRDATVAEAVATLCRHRVGALVVSGDGEHIDGIVSERDVVRRLNDLHGALVNEPVTTIMSPDVRTCAPEDDVESLMATMTEHRIRHVPVVHEGVLAGIVSIGDVVKARMEELQKDRDELVEYIHAR